MATNCSPAQRSRVHRATDGLADLRVVIAATPVPAAQSPTDRWAVHVLLRSGADGLPPAVANLLAGYDLRVRDVHRGRDYWHVTATA